MYGLNNETKRINDEIERATKVQAEVEYNGKFEEYEDKLDYVRLTLKGVRLG
jgi:hypothetical protein